MKKVRETDHCWALVWPEDVRADGQVFQRDLECILLAPTRAVARHWARQIAQVEGDRPKPVKVKVTVEHDPQ